MAYPNEKRLRNAFKTTTCNKAGAFSTQVYVRGVPGVVTVDDYLPFDGTYVASYNQAWLYFADQSSDGSIWSALMEKAFAKVCGNYEVLNGGQDGEAWNFVAGTPYTFYYTTDTSTINNNATKAYEVIV